MLTRRLNGKTLASLLVLLMTVCATAFAGLRDESWDVNPSDYRYDMSLYFDMDGQDFEDMSLFEIGAFVDDECRGLAEKLELPDGGSCLYMRIRSNQAEGENLSFYMKVKSTGQIITVRAEDGAGITFKADSRIGLPSEPFMMEPYFTATFKLDGEVYSTFEVGYNDPIEAPSVPDKEGYTFSGWGDVPATMPGYDIEIHSSYSVNFYKLTFKIGDEEIYSGEVAYGSVITVPDAPEKEGYTFVGWSPAVPETMPAYDLVLNGSYEMTKYALVYKIDGEVVHTENLVFGTVITPFNDVPAKKGHTFGGWTEIPSTMPAHDVEINGFYNINHYTVTFTLEGETISQTLAYEEEIIQPAAPDREGYSFSGWGDVPAVMPDRDLAFEGYYTINKYTAIFRIDQEVFQTLTLEYGAAINAPEAPEKEGHTFSGWGEVPATMPAHDLVFVGTYDARYFTITFTIGDEVVKQADLAYGTDIILPEVPEKEGYTFSGWGDVPATMPAYNVNISGSYSVNIYTLTFRIDDEIIYEGQLAYGTEIVAPEAYAKDGYSFSGWGIVPATMPASDLVISGTYTPNVYTLTFLIDGDVFYTTQVPYGSEIAAPEVPEKTGYTLNGWDNVPATMPAYDLSISGTYDINTYKLTFKIDNEVIFSGDLLYGDEIIAPEAPVKEGHTFVGWGMLPAVMPASDLEITGSYEANLYNLTFKIDGEVIYSSVQAYGSEIVPPYVTEIEGHTFSGWGDIPATMPAYDLEFVGTFAVNAHTLTFKIDGEVVSTQILAYGSEVSTPEIADREGYTFSGWGEVPATMPNHDIEINGSFIVNTYSLTFRLDEETIYTAQVAYGADITAPEVTDREGYTFSGWGVIPATMPAHDLVISGAFNVNSYSAVFKIDGEVFYSARINYGAAIEIPEVPAREGHTFSGWGEVPATMPAGDIEFEGKYAVNVYTIVFRVNDEVVSKSELAYGTEIVVPDVPAKEGYTFAGWGVVPATMPASDLEFSGIYEVNYYNVTFKINDDVVYSALLAYGSEIVAPEAPDNEGCTFSGWSEYPATVPAHDVEVTATYTANSYVLTVYLNDEIYLRETLTYGSEIILHYPEVPDGMKFDGWQEEVPGTMPAHDVDIHGTMSEDTTTWINCVMLNSDVTVYTVGGVLLFENEKAADIRDRLLPGFYIINGKTMMVK